MVGTFLFYLFFSLRRDFSDAIFRAIIQKFHGHFLNSERLFSQWKREAAPDSLVSFDFENFASRTLFGYHVFAMLRKRCG